MAATRTFDAAPLYDATTMTLLPNTQVQFLDKAGGTPQQVYDLQGNPLATLTSNSVGLVNRFKAGIDFGVVGGNGVFVPVVSMEALASGPQAAAAQAAAQAAQFAAETAAQQATAASTLAPNVSTRLTSLEQSVDTTNITVARKVDTVRWTGTGWPPRPSGAPAGLVYLSTNDPNAPAPTGATVGDVWRRHPDAA